MSKKTLKIDELRAWAEEKRAFIDEMMDSMRKSAVLSSDMLGYINALEDLSAYIDKKQGNDKI